MTKIKFPPKLKGLFTPNRFKVFYGGRGAAKSWSVARYLILLAYTKQVRILCTREYQISIADSVHKLLSDQIEALGLSSYFTITKASIISSTGSEFLFKGLHHNIQDIKSTEGIDICWVEEAEKVSQQSWDFLIPTIRQPKSEIIVTFNPHKESDPTYQKFIVNPNPTWHVQKVNYYDNDKFPDVLKDEMEWDKLHNHDKYLWIWEGQPLGLSDAQVFKGRFEVQEFEAMPDERLYFGADWGFATDPTTLIRCFIRDRRLYIDYEAYGAGVDIDDTPELFRSIPKSDKWRIYADCARPETISYMQRNGYPECKPCKKWAGSVEDGIEHIKGYDKIIVHPRCKHVLQELELYQYKTDRQTGEILPIIVDANNHCMDALRYALGDKIKDKNFFIV